VFVREIAGTEADRDTDLLSGSFMIESRCLGGTGGGAGFFIESFRVCGDDEGDDREGELNAIVFRLDFSEGGINDDGRDVGMSSPADRCLTRCIATMNSSRSMKSRSRVVSSLTRFYKRVTIAREKRNKKNAPNTI